jgi:hypothetical protein
MHIYSFDVPQLNYDCTTRNPLTMSDAHSILAIAQNLTWKNALTTTFVTWLTYWIVVGIYRVYFHPLAHIPGPKVTHQHKPVPTESSSDQSLASRLDFLVRILLRSISKQIPIRLENQTAPRTIRPHRPHQSDPRSYTRP